jgi:hypothetical protein
LTSLPDAVVVVAAAPWICRHWVVMLVVVGWLWQQAAVGRWRQPEVAPPLGFCVFILFKKSLPRV